MALRPMRGTAPVKRRKAEDVPKVIGKAAPKYMVPGFNVFDAAVERIKWLYDEFDGEISVATSGGKDSTVILELACRAAKELGIPKVKAWWIDQECEFQSTVDYQRYIMYERDDIDLHWYQVPFRLENATNLSEQFLNVWGPGEEWVRPKEPTTIHDNTYGQDTWYELLSAISVRDFDGAILDGIRSEESPSRRMTNISHPVYKWITWSVMNNDKPTNTAHYRFHPIHDWSYRDVWKAIHSNGWRYNLHYDHMFKYGVGLREMRVSNFHHAQALSQLHWLQEVEPETWDAATRRLAGISTYGHLKRDQIPRELPYMFSSWTEYMHYLIDNLIPEEPGRETFRKHWANLVRTCPGAGEDAIARVVISSIIIGDYYGIAVGNFQVGYAQSIKTRRGLNAREHTA